MPDFKPVLWVFLASIQMVEKGKFICVCTLTAPGAAGALHEDERRAATQAECAAGPAEEHGGEEGRHGGRPEGEKQRDRESAGAAGQNQQQQPCMQASHECQLFYILENVNHCLWHC